LGYHICKQKIKKTENDKFQSCFPISNSTESIREELMNFNFWMRNVATSYTCTFCKVN
jgi:hypothetical protein